MSQNQSFRLKQLLQVLKDRYPLLLGEDIRITETEIIVTPEAWVYLVKDSLYNPYPLDYHREGGCVGEMFGFKVRVVKRSLLNEAEGFNPTRR